jgi:hypothetical protein
MTQCNHNLRKVYRRDQTNRKDQYVRIDTHGYCLACMSVVKGIILSDFKTIRENFEATIIHHYPEFQMNIVSKLHKKLGFVTDLDSNKICYTIQNNPEMLFNILGMFDLYQANTGYTELDNTDYVVIDWDEINEVYVNE